MYLSFIQDKKDKLAEQITALEELEESLESRADDLVEHVRMEMMSAIFEFTDEAITDHDLDDPFGETSQELQEALQTYVEANL